MLNYIIPIGIVVIDSNYKRLALHFTFEPHLIVTSSVKPNLCFLLPACMGLISSI